MLKLMSHPSTICMTFAMANMLTPLISTVMNANETGGQSAARFAETQLQISRHRVGLGNVVERHHHQREEQHRRNGADPVPMRGQNAVLIGRTRPAHQLERAEIGGEKTQSRDPGGHLAARHEKIFAGVGSATQIETDGQYQREIENDDGKIDRRQVHQSGRANMATVGIIFSPLVDRSRPYFRAFAGNACRARARPIAGASVVQSRREVGHSGDRFQHHGIVGRALPSVPTQTARDSLPAPPECLHNSVA